MRPNHALLWRILLGAVILGFSATAAPRVLGADTAAKGAGGSAGAGTATGAVTWDPASLKFPPLRAVKLPDVQRTVLPNGIVLYLLEDHEYPTVEGRIIMRVGSICDPDDKVGLAAMTGEVLRSGGSEKHPGDEVDKRLDAIGASFDFNVDDAESNGSFWCLKENAPEVLGIVADLLQRPTFPQEKLDLAKVEMRRDIAGRNDEPDGIAFREIKRMIYGLGHPFSRIPEYATVEAVTRDDLLAFHDHYFRPDRVYLTLWGDFDAGQTRKEIAGLFADWKKGGLPPPEEPAVPKLVPGGEICYAEKKGVTATWMVAGHVGIKADNPDYATMNVMAELLGGGFSSRLINEIRTKRGLAYATGANSGADLPRPGVFLAYSSTQSDSALVALALLRKEIARLTEEPVGTDELELAKNTILNSYVFKFATKGRIAARMAYLDFYGYPADFTARYPDQVRKVTASQLLEVARRDIHPDDLQVILVGDQADFATPLSTLGNVKTIDLTIPEPPSKEPAAPEATPESIAKGKSVIEHAAEVTGGSAAWASIKDLTEDAEMTILVQGMSLGISSHSVQTADERDFLSQKLPFGEVVMVRVADAGWKKTPRGLEDLGPEDISSILEDRGRSFWSLFSRPDTYQFQSLGTEQMDGKGCDVVKISGGGLKKPANLYVDSQTGEPVAIRYNGQDPNGAPAEIQEIYSDWRAAGPVRIPFGIKTMMDGKPFGTGKVTNAVVNGGVDSKLFEKPPQ